MNTVIRYACTYQYVPVLHWPVFFVVTTLGFGLNVNGRCGHHHFSLFSSNAGKSLLWSIVDLQFHIQSGLSYVTFQRVGGALKYGQIRPVGWSQNAGVINLKCTAKGILELKPHYFLIEELLLNRRIIA